MLVLSRSEYQRRLCNKATVCFKQRLSGDALYLDILGSNVHAEQAAVLQLLCKLWPMRLLRSTIFTINEITVTIDSSQLLVLARSE